MFGIGTGELLLLLLLALFVLGPERMPRLARDIGKTVGDLRRSSDELRQEFLNADALIEKAASIKDVPKEPPAELEAGSLPGGATSPVDAAQLEPVAREPEAGLTQAEVGPEPGDPAAVEPEPGDARGVEPEPEETAFDREARLARQRLDDPARAERARAEGWTAPNDEAGTNTDRWS